MIHHVYPGSAEQAPTDIQAVFDGLVAGDQVHFHPGVYPLNNCAGPPYDLGAQVPAILSGIGTVVFEYEGSVFVNPASFLKIWGIGIPGYHEIHNISFSNVTIANRTSVDLTEYAPTKFYRCNFYDNTLAVNMSSPLGSEVEFHNCEFYDNDNSGVADQSACIQYSPEAPSRLTIISGNFHDNIARHGACLRADASNVQSEIVIVETNFLTNGARFGGAILTSRNIEIDIKYSIFGENYTDVGVFDGGAICFANPVAFPTDFLILNCIFYGNTASNVGGAILMDNSTANLDGEILNCTFYNNSDGGGGGQGHAVAMAGASASSLIIHNSIFDNNGVVGNSVRLGGTAWEQKYNIFNGPACNQNDATSLAKAAGTSELVDPANGDFYLDASSDAIDFCTHHLAGYYEWYQEGYVSGAKYLVDLVAADAGYHHTLEYPDLSHVYSFTSQNYDFNAIESGVFSRVLAHCQWDNLIGTVCRSSGGDPLTWTITSGVELVKYYGAGALSGHSLVSNAGDIVRVTNNVINDTNHCILTTDEALGADCAELREGELRIWVTVNADVADIWDPILSGYRTQNPYWFPVYDSYGTIYGAPLYDKLDTELLVVESGLRGRSAAFRLELIMPAGHAGDPYNRSEYVSGTTDPANEVDVFDPYTGESVARGIADHQGRYRIQVPPGHYDVRFIGHNRSYDDRILRYSAGHGRYSSKFGKEMQETISQYKHSIAVSQIGDALWGKYLIYEQFINESGRTTEPEIYNSGIVEDGLWRVSHSYVDWFYLGVDPSLFETRMEATPNEYFEDIVEEQDVF